MDGEIFEIFDNQSNHEFNFSIIISIFNMEEFLEESINSIINQTLNFEKNTQLILVDDGSIDKSKDIAFSFFKKYPNNIVFISKSNEGQGKSRNIALNYVRGKYVNFLDADDFLSNETLMEVYEFFNKYGEEVDIVSIPLILFGREEGEHRLNYKYETTRIINLLKEPNNPQLSASSSFIRVEAIGNLRFSEKIISSEDCIFVNKILLKKKKLGVINTAKYFYRQRFDESSTIDNSIYNKRYYTERLKYYFIDLIKYSLSKEGSILSFIQYTLAYDFQWLFKLDSLDIFENSEELNEFWGYMDYVSDCIGDNAIVHNRNIENRFKSFFMFLRKKTFTLELDNSNNLLLKSKDYVIDTLNKHKIYMDHIEIIENKLIISAFFVSNFNYDSINIKLIAKSKQGIKKYDCIQFKYLDNNRDIVSFLSINWKFCLNFDVKIPLNEDILEIGFEINFKENNIEMNFNPVIDLNYGSGLSTSSAYFIKNNKIVLFKYGKINILPYKYLSILRYEYSNFRKILRDKNEGYINALFIRMVYVLLYPFYKNKNIWLFSDRPDVADDNGIQLYRYALEINDKNIKKYFVIDKKSKNFNEIRSFSKNIIQYKSLKHKILFLFSKKNISSYVNTEFVNPFDFENIDLYTGLITTENYFLQHGIIKDDVSLQINRYKKNLRLFLTSADLERDSIVNGKYNFDDSIVKALGLPRYDNLDSKYKVKKQILFAPTWRMNITSKQSFLKSDYFMELNFLINNEKLDNLLEKNGYQLIFKPHPELIKYLDELKISENVKLVIDDKYQKLFNESALLITDYSSVFFDFAYLKKPVIYFHSNPYHYNEGYFKYESMGFGDIVKTNQDLFNKIKFYLLFDCKMEDKYKKRVDKFFKYNDKNNSKRVYDWILKN